MAASTVSIGRYGAFSITNSRSPASTSCPSSNSRCSRKPSTRARRSTLSMASIRPVKLTEGVISRSSTLTTVTAGAACCASAACRAAAAPSGRQRSSHGPRSSILASAALPSTARRPPPPRQVTSGIRPVRRPMQRRSLKPPAAAAPRSGVTPIEPQSNPARTFGGNCQRLPCSSASMRAASLRSWLCTLSQGQRARPSREWRALTPRSARPGDSPSAPRSDATWFPSWCNSIPSFQDDWTK